MIYLRLNRREVFRMDELNNKLFNNSGLVVNPGNMFKLPLIILFIANIFYSFLLLLKSKILTDTVSFGNNRKIKIVVYANVAISIVTSILGSILILLG